MTTSGRIFLLTVVCLLIAGAAFGQEEPAEEPTSRTDASSEPAAAKSGSRSHNVPFGVRAGYTHWKEVDQAHFGVHAYLGELWPNVEFTPNIEVGFGDDVLIMTVNADVAYMFTEFVTYPWDLYGGGSLSFNLVDPDHGGSDTDLGLSGLIGTRYTFANDHRGMFEFRFGIMDSPAIKLTAGYTLF